jgi:hypothetical protein
VYLRGWTYFLRWKGLPTHGVPRLCRVLNRRDCLLSIHLLGGSRILLRGEAGSWGTLRRHFLVRRPGEFKGA